MRDLDMGDVLSDAQDMKDQYYNKIYRDLESLSRADLDSELYHYGIQAREGREFAMDVVQMIGHIRLGIIATSLCEGCLNRTGCEMCCPTDWGFYDYPEYDAQTDHFERFGRPEFPNEY